MKALLNVLALNILVAMLLKDTCCYGVSINNELHNSGRSNSGLLKEMPPKGFRLLTMLFNAVLTLGHFHTS